MNKLKQVGLRLTQLLSSNRRRKANILFQEWFIGFTSRFKTGSNELKDFPPDPAIDVLSVSEYRTIDPDYFNRGAAAVVEDKVVENGQIFTEHAYSIGLLIGASSYTNETTHRSIFDSSGELVNVFSSVKGIAGSHTSNRRKLPISKTIPGVTANLYGTVASADGNYFHWFVDTLSRLFLIEKFHPKSRIDQVLVPPLKYDFQWESLSALGFERANVIELNPLECLQFEQLLASSAPRGKGSAICPGWIVENYNTWFLEKVSELPAVAGKRVYISRRDAPKRMFINEQEICDYLERRGFDIIELTPLTLWQKIAVFRNAEIIIGQTGAGLTNLMFCQSNVKGIELVDERFVYPMYASMVAYAGGAHRAHFFASAEAAGSSNAILAKSSLDMSEFERSLDLFDC